MAIIPPRACFFGEPRQAPIPGPAEFPICYLCHTPYILRRTQGYHEPNQEIAEWRFFQDCKCKPARYKVINETKDQSHGAQIVSWLARQPEMTIGWTIEVPSPAPAEATVKVSKRARKPRARTR